MLRRAKTQHGEAVTRLELVVRTWRHAVEAAAQDSRGHSAAGVADLEVQLDEPASVLGGELDTDAAAVGAIDRRMQQGQQDLLEAP